MFSYVLAKVCPPLLLPSLPGPLASVGSEDCGKSEEEQRQLWHIFIFINFDRTIKFNPNRNSVDKNLIFSTVWYIVEFIQILKWNINLTLSYTKLTIILHSAEEFNRLTNVDEWNGKIKVAPGLKFVSDNYWDDVHLVSPRRPPQSPGASHGRYLSGRGWN